MSTPRPCGRAMPRWSVVGAPAEVPASIAGLPDNKAMVMVGPPLSASEASLGSIGDAAEPTRSPGATNPLLLAAPIKLQPSERNTPETSWAFPLLSATRVLSGHVEPPALHTPPPIRLVTIVQLIRNKLL